ncbi:MAG: DinB family protein [Alphaproteobacteria bacterium]|nr:DinB family protein [Alphaproteobacteria bacterium]
MLLGHFRRFARYNEWANDRLYDACAALSQEEYIAPRQAFFGSIHRTLNHLLLVDRIWLSRLGVGDLIIDPLDTELYSEFEPLRRARAEQNRVIIDYVDAQTEASLTETKQYANASGQPQETRHDIILQHYFNHQAHHRGQVHDMLSQTAVAPPPLDMIYFVREVPDAA